MQNEPTATASGRRTTSSSITAHTVHSRSQKGRTSTFGCHGS